MSSIAARRTILSMLHPAIVILCPETDSLLSGHFFTVDEADPQLDKMDKIYKTLPIFNYRIPKFRHCFAPGCELSLDEGDPYKNKLSFKQYIKDKPIKWGIKTFLLCDSETGYIINAEVYSGKRADDNLIANLGVTGNYVDFHGSIPHEPKFYSLY